MTTNKHLINSYGMFGPDVTKAEKLLGRALMHGMKVEHFGSRTIEGAARRGSDWDYIILDNRYNKFDSWCNRNKLDNLGSDFQDAKFKSYRLGPLNFIVTSDESMFEATVNANSVCVEASITDRSERIKVFEFLRDPDNSKISDFELESIFTPGTIAA